MPKLQKNVKYLLYPELFKNRKLSKKKYQIYYIDKSFDLLTYYFFFNLYKHASNVIVQVKKWEMIHINMHHPPNFNYLLTETFLSSSIQFFL